MSIQEAEESRTFVVNRQMILNGVSETFAAYDPFTGILWGAGDTEEDAEKRAAEAMERQQVSCNDIDLLIERVSRRRPLVHFHK